MPTALGSKIIHPFSDFALQLGGDIYLFIFELSATSDTRVHTKAKGPGKRRFTGVPARYGAAHWMDNGENLKLEYDAASKALTLDATGYPYGTNTVVRVAKVST